MEKRKDFVTSLLVDAAIETGVGNQDCIARVLSAFKIPPDVATRVLNSKHLRRDYPIKLQKVTQDQSR